MGGVRIFGGAGSGMRGCGWVWIGDGGNVEVLGGFEGLWWSGGETEGRSWIGFEDPDGSGSGLETPRGGAGSASRILITLIRN